MEAFAERLAAVRKEKGLTQEQLAALVQVSRQTVSHWEHGRVIPNDEMTEKLSAALGYDFIADKPIEEPAPVSEEEPASEDMSAEDAVVEDMPAKDAPAPKRRRGIIIAAAVLALAAVIIAVLAFALRKESIPANIEFVPDAAEVCAMVDPDYAGGIGWQYGFTINYTGDGPFTITAAEERHILPDTDEFNTIVYDDELIDMIFLSHVIEPGSTMYWNGGMPYQPVSAVMLVITGTDSRGNEHTFSGTITLLPDITGDLSSLPGHVNYPSITIEPESEAVYPTENDEHIGGSSWFYGFTITNNGNSAITITGMDEAFTQTDGSGSFMSAVPDDVITHIFGSFTIRPGQTAYYNGGTGVQPIDMYTLIIRGTDETGTEWEFSGSVELCR